MPTHFRHQSINVNAHHDEGTPPSPIDRPLNDTEQQWSVHKKAQLSATHVAVLCIVASQCSAVIMNAMAQVLETQSKPRINPLQVLDVRMGVTAILCHICGSWVYGRKNQEEVVETVWTHRLRVLLALRCVAGTCAATGYYYSLVYLQLHETAILSLLAPLGAFCLLKLIRQTPVSIAEALAIMASILGALLIVLPQTPSDWKRSTNESNMERRELGAIIALLGAAGGSVAYTCIQLMGTEVSPLTTTKYFGATVALITTTIQIIVPGAHFQFHFNLDCQAWVMSIAVGLLGFLVETLLAKGLSTDARPCVTQAIYTQSFLAMLFDWIVWGKPPGLLMIAGALIITTSTLLLLAGPSAGERKGQVKKPVEMAEVEEEDA